MVIEGGQGRCMDKGTGRERDKRIRGRAEAAADSEAGRGGGWMGVWPEDRLVLKQNYYPRIKCAAKIIPYAHKFGFSLKWGGGVGGAELHVPQHLVV